MSQFITRILYQSSNLQVIPHRQQPTKKQTHPVSFALDYIKAKVTKYQYGQRLQKFFSF
jgi:hypothetical protein